MPTIQVTCPGCQVVLTVPREAIGKKGKCRACGMSFEIAPPRETVEVKKQKTPVETPAKAKNTTSNSLDDNILGWLTSDTSQPGIKAQNRLDSPEAGKAGSSGKSLKIKRYDVKLDHVDTMGAFFRFDSSQLYDEDFRSSLPHECLICGIKHGLSIHLIVWSGKLVGRYRNDFQNGRSPFVWPLEKFAGLHGAELTAKLSQVEHMPKPYSLPFPYYVCRTCSAVGAMVTDVHIVGNGEREICELGISSLRQAETFALTVCGPDTPAVKAIRDARKASQDDPWLKLPLTIRVRIQRWYELCENEKFEAYFPDADYSKAEAGLAGVVLTNLRLIYHKSTATSEMSLSDPIYVNTKSKGSRLLLEIKPAGGTAVQLAALPAYAEEFKRILRRYGHAASAH